MPLHSASPFAGGRGAALWRSRPVRQPKIIVDCLVIADYHSILAISSDYIDITELRRADGFIMAGMKMSVYARTAGADGDDQSWQPLKDHLEGGAACAEALASAFGAADWGRLVGLWHDLCKYQPEFHARLRGQGGSVEHSGAGAALAFAQNKELGLPLAFVIAGHHSGLANLQASGPGLPSPLLERIKDNTALLERLRPLVDQELFVPSLPGLPPYLAHLKKAGARDPLRLGTEFWIRLLFSAQVDAGRKWPWRRSTQGCVATWQGGGTTWSRIKEHPNDTLL